MTIQWKLLPNKANKAMAFAGAEAAKKYLEETGCNSSFVIYEAMAAAAPQMPAPGGEPEVRAWEVEMYGPYDTLEDAEAKSQHAGYPVHELIRLSDYRAQITSLQAHIADLKSAGEYFHCHAIGDTPEEVCGAWEQHADAIFRPSIGGE